MRISTIGYQTNALEQMQSLEQALAQTQSQLGSGLKLQNAADNPAAMAQVNSLDAQLSSSQQFVTNGNLASSNLQLEAQALTGATNVLQSARDLALQANDASLTQGARQAIATQLQQQLAQLVSIANSTDSSGNYLFSGIAAGTQPFIQSGNAVGYAGAQSVSQIQISSNQSVSAGDTGAAVFMNAPAGNGTFATAAAAGNTGSASIDPGTVTDPSAWVPDTYTISFTSPTDYQVTNSGGGVVASGTLSGAASSGTSTIAFNGIQVDLSGTPAAGDQFTITPAGKVSAFATLSSLIGTLNSGSLNPAQLATAIGGAVQQIDGALNTLGSAQSSVGARLNTITASQSSAQSTQTHLQSQVSQLQDVDYAQAITQLNTEELSLQAAQQSYAAIGKLSLFNYL